ncbi:cytochrome P450 [Xylaria venustula]|nr:cytochrome P450 [Xylaria venustula]
MMLAFSVWYTIFAVFLFYGFNTLRLYRAQERTAQAQLPPRNTTWLPYPGNIFQFIFNGRKFLEQATYMTSRPASVKIPLFPGLEIYFFQEPETVKEIWRRSSMLKSVNLRLFFYGYIFGMSPRWLALFRADNSGPFPKPYPGTTVPPTRRIHHLLYEGTHTALAGSGFRPTLERLRADLIYRIENVNEQRQEWTEFKDLRHFVLHNLGGSFICAIFGPSLLHINPTFIDDLAEFNHFVPFLSRGLPRLLVPQAYRAREKVKDHLKRWYAHARSHVSNGSGGDDGDADPLWGSSWMKNRQRILGSMEGDDDALASSDLGVAWGSIVNLVPSTIMALVHILANQDLLERVRKEIRQTVGDKTPMAEIDLNALSENDLLSSIYAETLRLHVKLNIVVSSQRDDLLFGKWHLPKARIGLINCHVSQMNADFWNTNNGNHPVDSFWAERFLTDPSNPLSGPVSPNHRRAESQAAQSISEAKLNPRKKSFTLDGIEGTWVPYGGGQLMCPGRFLAKHAIILTCAILLRDHDLELLTESIATSSRNFGIGTEQPRDPVPFRLRKQLRDCEPVRVMDNHYT